MPSSSYAVAAFVVGADHFLTRDARASWLTSRKRAGDPMTPEEEAEGARLLREVRREDQSRLEKNTPTDSAPSSDGSGPQAQ